MRPGVGIEAVEVGVARRWRRWTLGLCAVALVSLSAASAAHAADRIYWSNFENDTIAWTNLDGSGGGGTVNTGDAMVDGPMGLTIDPAHGRIYWANWASHMGMTISYANLDGSGGGDLQISGDVIHGPHGLAIDPTDGPYGTLYWPNHDMEGEMASSISRVRLNDTGTGGVGQDLPIADATLDEPRGMMIDPETGRIYWANFAAGFGMSISYANLDGSGGANLIDDIGAFPEAPEPPDEPRGPEGTAIDPATGKIYWSDFGQRHLIQYANANGTGISALNTDGAGAHGVHGVAIDPQTNRIYWANWYSNGIGWANLDGSGGGDLKLDAPATMVNRPNLPSILKQPAATAPPTVSGGSEPGAKLTCSPGTWAGDVIESLMYRAPQGDSSYRWTRDGANLPGSSGTSITATVEGKYRCLMTAGNAAGSTTQASAAHVVKATPPPPPSNEFTFGKIKRNRTHGTAKVAVELPGPGVVKISGSHLQRFSKHPAAPGEASLKVKPRGKVKRTLLRRGKATVRPRVTFTPTGGDANTLSERVELIEKRKIKR